MPYTRRRRRPYRRYRRNYRTSKKLYRAINNVVKRKLEVKFIDHADQPLVNAAGNIIDLTDTTQGTLDDAERIGDKINWVSMVQRGIIIAGDLAPWNTVRIMVVQWKEDDQSDPVTFAKVLQSTSYPWMSAYNHDEGFKFSVLYDRVFTNLSDSTNGQGVRAIKYSFRLRPTGRFTAKTIKYKGASSYGKGKLYLMLISDSYSLLDPVVNYYNRVTYTDA